MRSPPSRTRAQGLRGLNPPSLAARGPPLPAGAPSLPPGKLYRTAVSALPGGRTPLSVTEPSAPRQTAHPLRPRPRFVPKR